MPYEARCVFAAGFVKNLRDRGSAAAVGNSHNDGCAVVRINGQEVVLIELLSDFRQKKVSYQQRDADDYRDPRNFPNFPEYPHAFLEFLLSFGFLFFLIGAAARSFFIALRIGFQLVDGLRDGGEVNCRVKLAFLLGRKNAVKNLAFGAGKLEIRRIDLGKLIFAVIRSESGRGDVLIIAFELGIVDLDITVAFRRFIIGPVF